MGTHSFRCVGTMYLSIHFSRVRRLHRALYRIRGEHDQVEYRASPCAWGSTLFQGRSSVLLADINGYCDSLITWLVGILLRNRLIMLFGELGLQPAIGHLKTTTIRYASSRSKGKGKVAKSGDHPGRVDGFIVSFKVRSQLLCSTQLDLLVCGSKLTWRSWYPKLTLHWRDMVIKSWSAMISTDLPRAHASVALEDFSPTLLTPLLTYSYVSVPCTYHTFWGLTSLHLHSSVNNVVPLK